MDVKSRQHNIGFGTVSARIVREKNSTRRLGLFMNSVLYQGFRHVDQPWIAPTHEYVCLEDHLQRRKRLFNISY